MHADPLLDERTQEPVVSFRLMPSSKRKLGEFTTANVGRKVEIRVDGQVLMSPVIREPITNGVVQVSGHFTLREAADLAARLTAGTSKIEVELVPD